MSGEDRLTATLVNMLQDPGYLILSQSLFPDAPTAADISDIVRRTVRRALSADIVDCFYAEFSIGAAFGCALSDGSRIAAKFHLPSVSRRHLEAVAAVQRWVRGRRVPCPDVPVAPVSDGVRTVRFERWSTDGEERDRITDRAREEIAQVLARLVQEAEGCPEHADLEREDWPEALWPVPHNALFDFDRTSHGAEWIDDCARNCREAIRSVPDSTIAGHMDWSLQHFRFRDDDSVAMIYDWDSLRQVPEVRLVGSAAACFTLRNEPVSTPPPTPLEAREFVLAYERCRSVPFTADQWRAVSAAALYALCYGARCEHALGDTQHSKFRSCIRKLRTPAFF